MNEIQLETFKRVALRTLTYLQIVIVLQGIILFILVSKK